MNAATPQASSASALPPSAEELGFERDLRTNAPAFVAAANPAPILRITLLRAPLSGLDKVRKPNTLT